MGRLPAARLELDVEDSCRTGRRPPRRRCRSRCTSRRACLHSCKGGRTCGDMRQDAGTGKWGQREAQNGDGFQGVGIWEHRILLCAGRFRPRPACSGQGQHCGKGSAHRAADIGTVSSCAHLLLPDTRVRDNGSSLESTLCTEYFESTKCTSKQLLPRRPPEGRIWLVGPRNGLRRNI